MKLSVVIPVYNEKNTILSILRKVSEVPIEKEIIVVDDGSSDGTRELLQKVTSHRSPATSNIKIIFQKRNQGKGAAIRRGFKEITGDAVIIQDADLEYVPRDYLLLMKPLQEGRAKVVYGSRFTGDWTGFILLNYLANRFLNIMTTLLYGVVITDMETCYKLLAREVVDGMRVRAERFDFEPEITARILRKGYRIIEVPISYHGRSYREGKKIGWKDGFMALWCLLKYRITSVR